MPTAISALTAAGALTGAEAFALVQSGATRKEDLDAVARFFGTGASVTVASIDAPDEVRRRADYVCDGTADEVQIQAALDASKWGTGTAAQAVQLTAGRFYITDTITLYQGQTIRGSGRGSTALLVQNGSFTSNYVFVNSDPQADNSITIRDMWIDCDFNGVGGIHLNNYDATFGDPINSANDSSHIIENVYIKAPGASGAAHHGVYLNGTGGTTQNSRGNWIFGVRVTQSYGDAIRYNDSSDNYTMRTVVNTNRSGGTGVGYNIGGGSCKFLQCKSFYTNSDGFLVSSSRALLAGCYAQDAGAYGFNLASVDTVLTGAVADSSNRLNTGDAGVRIAGSNILYTGQSIDRNQSANRQQYGFRYVSGDNIRIDAITDGNVVGPEVGAWTGATERRIYLMDSTLGSLESVSTPTSFS